MTPLSLKIWRVARGLSQAQLAMALGVTQQTISVWETGRGARGAPVAIPDDLEARLEAIDNLRDMEFDLAN